MSLFGRNLRIWVGHLGRAAIGWAWLALAVPAWANDLVPASLNVGFLRTCFVNVNHADAETAFKVLAKTVGRERGYDVSTRTQIFESPAEIEAAATSGAVNLVLADSWNYLFLKLGDHFQPCFVSSVSGQVGMKYVVVTRQGSGLTRLTDLRGKELAELDLAAANAGGAWLRTSLLEGRLGAPEDFFGAVTVVSKPALAVLPVFFGKKPACLVDRSSFDLMGELNPQVVRELQVVAESEPYADKVVCVGDAGWGAPNARHDIVEILRDLHKLPAGEQILRLFKVGPLVPFEEPQLATVRQLRGQFEQLRRPPSPPDKTGPAPNRLAAQAP